MHAFAQPWMSPDAIKQCPAAAVAGVAAEETPRGAPASAVVGKGLRAGWDTKRWYHPMVGSRPMPHADSVLWNTMVAPFTRQTFRGVVFYQGESNALPGQNAAAAAYYACAIRALITDWRLKFAGDDLAFHATLLAPINTLWGFAGIRLGQQAQLNM